MITLGSEILVCQKGARKRVEELEVGSCIVNPIQNQCTPITKILSRNIPLNCSKMRLSSKLSPVLIEENQIAQNRPYRRTVVSPSQVVCFAKTQLSNSRYDAISNRMAKEIGFETLKMADYPIVARAHYFAIFTDKEQVIDVNGLLLMTYSNAVFENGGVERNKNPAIDHVT